MILGPGKGQLYLLKAAKAENYSVILCAKYRNLYDDTLVDRFYQVDYCFDNRDSVLAIARQEQIDGIVTNSEYGIQTSAYVAEELSLRGSPLSSIR